MSNSHPDASVTNSVEVLQGSATVLHSVDVFNPSTTTAAYLKFFDASSVTLASDTATILVHVPAGQARQVWLGDCRFRTACRYAATQEAGAGATAPASALVIQVMYD